MEVGKRGTGGIAPPQVLKILNKCPKAWKREKSLSEALVKSECPSLFVFDINQVFMHYVLITRNFSTIEHDS